MPDSFGRMVVLPLLPAFMEQYPDIELDLTFEDRIGDIIKEGADVGIGVMLNHDSSLIARDFYKVQPVVVASRDYVKVHGAPKTLDDLSKHNCIAYRSSKSGRKQNWNFRVNGEQIQVVPHGNLTVNNLSAAVKAVEMGVGIATVGIEQSSQYIESGCFRRVLKEYEVDPIQVMIYYSSRSYLPAKTRLFIDHLVTNVKETVVSDLDDAVSDL